jgi:hypothetical protein
MSEQDRSRERDHWQAIAEQLGLAPERESAGGELPAVSKPAPQPATPRFETPAKGAAQADLVAEESVITPTEPKRSIPEEPAAPEAAGDADETVAELEPSQPEPQQRPRRRGRGRRRPEEDVPAAADAAEAAVLPSSEEAEEQQGDRRRRGRRKKAEAASELPEVKEEAVAVEPDKDKDEEMDDLGDFSEWNVPSWNELIASLYRPGR